MAIDPILRESVLIQLYQMIEYIKENPNELENMDTQAAVYGNQMILHNMEIITLNLRISKRKIED